MDTSTKSAATEKSVEEADAKKKVLPKWMAENANAPPSPQESAEETAKEEAVVVPPPAGRGRGRGRGRGAASS
jgi:hypothetical protein